MIRQAIGAAPAALALLLAVAGCREGVLDADINHMPIIHAIDQTPAEVFEGQVVTLRVEASDEDADGIRFFWSAEVGTFDNLVGESVRWTAPSASGDAVIRVSANDRVSAATTATIRIRVRSVSRGRGSAIGD